jgi:hypothetical protein
MGSEELAGTGVTEPLQTAFGKVGFGQFDSSSIGAGGYWLSGTAPSRPCLHQREPEQGVACAPTNPRTEMGSG